MTHQQMDAIVPHPGWADGRYGYVWCRFDAYLREEGHVRAEITWNDDSEDNTEGIATVYYAPELRIETNRATLDGSLTTIDAWNCGLSEEKAVQIVTNDPKQLLDTFRDRVNQLAKC